MDNIQPYLLMMLSSYKNDNNQDIFRYLPIIVMILPILLRIIPFDEIKDNILSFFSKKENDIILKIIPSHSVPVIRGCSSTPISKIIYSKNFLAIIYYITKNNLSNFDSLTEILVSNTELNFNYYNDNDNSEGNKFTFMPTNQKRILISKEYGIYFELTSFESENNDEDDKNKNKKTTDKKVYNKKNYIIKLLKKRDMKNELNNMNILNKFINECVEEYENLNKFKDDRQYIFQYKNSEKCESKLELHFNEYLMEHNKDLLVNIFFEEKDKLINYIKPFIYNPDEKINIGEEKYKRSGFTFKAGILFYGSPGCGKTSTIKAILKNTNRHGIIVNLHKIQTCEELENIFRKREFKGKKLNGKQLCYILEDCDAIDDNNIIQSRTKNDETNITKLNELTELSQINKLVEYVNSPTVKLFKSHEDSVNLSCFLNILDGIIELHGVMIIMTSNYPEKIDSALIRPGRFDFKYEFKKASKRIIKEMLAFKFELSEKEINNYTDNVYIKDEVLSPADVQSICFQNDNIITCINEIALESKR
jgi:hypothetical protein